MQRYEQRPRVIVAGGGVAALETLLALHALLGRRIELELLAPGTHFLNRPAAVAEPFGLGGAATTPVADVAARCHAETHEGTLAAVRPDDRIAVTDDGAELAYDRLVIAVGARPAGDAARRPPLQRPERRGGRPPTCSSARKTAA